MAVSMNAGGGRGRGGHRRTYRPMAEINVTPMVDVMLVLLVIFMVTAPLLTVGVQVDLPKTKAAAMPGEDEPLAITVDHEGRIWLQETEVDMQTLVPKLIAVTGANPDIRIFIRGDKAIDYGRVMQVMGAVNGAGFSKVGLVSETLRAPGTPAGAGGERR